MQQPGASSEERAGPSTSAEGGFTRAAAREPLSPRWLELLANLNAVCAAEVEPSPPIQPEQSADGYGGRSLALSEELPGTEADPPSLTKLLAQLEARNRTDMELRRWCGAVDRAVAELVRYRLGRTGDQ
jgi:hypothetical protein